MAVAGAGPRVPRGLPRLPDDRHDRPELPEQGRHARSSGSTTTPGSSPTTRRSAPCRNNVLWLVAADGRSRSGSACSSRVLVDRVRYEAVAKTRHLPAAGDQHGRGRRDLEVHVRLPAAGRSRRPARSTRVIGAFGLGPVAWLQSPTLGVNTFALIVVMVWMWTGFAMVILSAALKGIDPELLEAARVDGANEWQVFRGITFPLLVPDARGRLDDDDHHRAEDVRHRLHVMTNGNYDTEVIANLMFKQMFTSGNFGRASAVAVVLLLAIIPVMAFNIRRFRAQEADPMTTRTGRRPPRADPRPGAGRASVGRLPIHLVIVFLMLVWLIPTVGLLVNSFRPARRGRDVRLVDGAVHPVAASPSTTTSTCSSRTASVRLHQQPVHLDPGHDHPDHGRRVRGLRVRLDELPRPRRPVRRRGRPARGAAAVHVHPDPAAVRPRASASPGRSSRSGWRTPATGCRSRSSCCATSWARCRARSSSRPRSTGRAP